MKSVKLKTALLIEDVHRKEGDVVLLSDQRAAEFARDGHGEIVDSGATVNPNTNPLMDSIHPQPPLNLLVVPADLPKSAPIDALAPVVQDNPGLVDLTNAVAAGAPGAPKRTGKPAPPEGK
jgi:hypothetical protein